MSTRHTGIFQSASLFCLLMICVSLSALAQEKETPEIKGLDRVQEFTVNKSGLESSSGSASSLADLVNAFPQSRRGDWHGSVYEFHRNDNLDARNFFDTAGEPLPEYKRNQFGGSLNKSLGQRFNILGAYDALRIGRGSTILSHVPTSSMKSGDFSSLLSRPEPLQLLDPLTGQPFSGNQIPYDRFSPPAVRLLDQLPNPNRADDPDRNFVSNEPEVIDSDELLIQADYQFSNGASLAASYVWERTDEIEVHSLPAFASATSERDAELSVRTHFKVRPNLIVDAEGFFDRGKEQGLPRDERPVGLTESLGIAGISAPDELSEGYPIMSMSNYESFGDEETSSGGFENRFGSRFDISWTTGSHALQFEAGLARVQINNHRSPILHHGKFRFTGRYSGDAFADFLLGLPDSATRSLGTSRVDLRSMDFQFGIVDRWQVSPRFTLTAGIEYELSEPYRSTVDNVSLFHPLMVVPPSSGEWVVPGSPRAAELGLARVGPRGMVVPDRNNWAPQLGLAIRPLAGQAFVLRMGFRMNYRPLEEEDYIDYLGRNYPFYQVEQAQSQSDEPELDLSDPFTSAAPAELTARGITPWLQTATYHQWNAGVEYQIGQNFVTEIRYQGYKGTHLSRILPGNIPLPGPGPVQERRPNIELGTFTILDDGGSAIGHELDVQIDRRFAGGFATRFDFEWGRRFSDDSDGEPSNPRNIAAEWAPGDGQVLSLHANYIFELPFGPDRRFNPGGPAWFRWFLEGWQFSGVTSIHGGERFTVLLPGDANNDGLDNDRPDRLSSGNLPKSGRNPDHWFDTSAFGAPETYAFGNAGRHILEGPGHVTWDLSLVKNTTLADGHRLQLRLSAFNAFNKANFGTPGTTVGSALFGKISSAGRARELEISIRYIF